ncbi:glycoside hydrolase family 18 protein [Marasmius fiardii PR-910]|nr:glycoside hydrolase family 18 protein [Marasmius fiardii PR-910]
MFTLLFSTSLLVSLAVSKPPTDNSSKVANAWYPGWRTDRPPSEVSWEKYTHMTYAFALTTPDVAVLSFEGSNPEGIPAFVEQAKKNGVKALVSVGGWSGSRFFSTAVGSPENRTVFVKTVTDLATRYELDGLDFDWEFPNLQALGCNVINANDTANYILFLEELRSHPVGKDLIITSAVSMKPFNDASGNPSSDLSRFAATQDFITIMNYDIWGHWSASVGPTAALNDSCAAPANQQGSAVSSVAKWTAAGVPLNKLLLGLPTYGQGFTVKVVDAFKNGSTTELAEYPPFSPSNRPNGDQWDGVAGAVDVCGVVNPAGGMFTFQGLINEGYLATDGAPKLPYRFDNCSKGAFVYNAEKQVMVAYDSAETWQAKGKYIKETDLAGFSIWSSAGDSNDILLDSVRGALFN